MKSHENTVHLKPIICKRELKIDVTLGIIVYIDILIYKNILFGKW